MLVEEEGELAHLQLEALVLEVMVEVELVRKTVAVVMEQLTLVVEVEELVKEVLLLVLVVQE